MKRLTKYDFHCGKIMLNVLKETSVTLYMEHGAYHLKSKNILGSGVVWEVFSKHNEALNQFSKLVIIQKGINALSDYAVKE